MTITTPVWVSGFEPLTSCSRNKRSTNLNYTQSLFRASQRTAELGLHFSNNKTSRSSFLHPPPGKIKISLGGGLFNPPLYRWVRQR